MYSQTSVPTTMSYAPATYGFDVASTVAHYPVQQHYNMNYQGAASPAPYSPAASTFADSAASTSGLSSVPHSPYIKAEAPSPLSYASDDRSLTPSIKSSSPEPLASTSPVFGTGVDCLMRAIQTQQKHDGVQFQPHDHHARPRNPRKNKKMHQCPFHGCQKIFYQKTHLDIHTRRHTGYKPYTCDVCDQKFSQMGNLRTHQRRHTGERPYHCDICGKNFAQRGNVRAHRLVHLQTKPYICKLDDCGKPFSQLGNLKSHQNKFHLETLQLLTEKFYRLDLTHASGAEKDMLQYFSELYKNANKGIKGRGKDRRISITAIPEATAFSLASSAQAYSAMVATAPAPMMVRTDTSYSVQGNASVSSNSSCSSPYQQHHQQLQLPAAYNMAKYVG